MSRSKLNELMTGIDQFGERTGMEQQASEILGYRSFQERMSGYYQDIAGWGKRDSDELVLDDYGILPEFAMPWYPGCIHQMFLERAGWFPLEGQRLKMCEASRFSSRFDAYEYLSRGERVICVASTARYWVLRVWDDTPEDIERLKAAGKWDVIG